MITVSVKKESPVEKAEPLAVNTSEAARLLGVSERTVHNLVKRGKIVCKKVGWRSIFPIASLKAFLESSDNE